MLIAYTDPHSARAWGNGCEKLAVADIVMKPMILLVEDGSSSLGRGRNQSADPEQRIALTGVPSVMLF